MRTGAWLLIGIGSALVILTLLLVFIIPSGRRRRLPGSDPRRLRMPRFKIPSGSPAGSLLKGLVISMRRSDISGSITALEDDWSMHRTDRRGRPIDGAAAGRPGVAADGRPGQRAG